MISEISRVKGGFWLISTGFYNIFAWIIQMKNQKLHEDFIWNVTPSENAPFLCHYNKGKTGCCSK